MDIVDKDSLYAKAYCIICQKHSFCSIDITQIDNLYYVFGNRPEGNRPCIFAIADSNSSRWSDYVYLDKSNGELTGPEIVEELFKMAKDYDIGIIESIPTLIASLNWIPVIKKGSIVEEFLIDYDMRANRAQ